MELAPYQRGWGFWPQSPLLLKLPAIAWTSLKDCTRPFPSSLMESSTQTTARCPKTLWAMTAPCFQSPRVSWSQTIGLLSRCQLSIALWDLGSDRISFFTEASIPHRSSQTVTKFLGEIWAFLGPAIVSLQPGPLTCLVIVSSHSLTPPGPLEMSLELFDVFSDASVSPCFSSVLLLLLWFSVFFLFFCLQNIVFLLLPDISKPPSYPQILVFFKIGSHAFAWANLRSWPHLLMNWNYRYALTHQS
jgi:hypothetical protein